jgi:TonB family protein
MFDFAISQNRRQPLTGRHLASWIVSCIAHLLALLLLIQYPQLLLGGMAYNFRSFPLISRILGPKSNDDNRNWRSVAILSDPSKMSAPSAATLKKYLIDWNKKGQNAPIQVNWGDVQAALADLPPMPRVRQKAKDPKLSLPANDLASAGSAAASEDKDAASASSTPGPSDSDAERKRTINLPPPEPAPVTEASIDNPPSKIPDSIKPPPDTSPETTNGVKVFEDEQKAIHSRESGFFDTKGFPLGEYANLIVERVKGNWFIPASLKNSRGRTTVIFYINKAGRYTNARIVTSSGSKTFDTSALMAIIESNPFPPLPKGFPGEQVGAKFIFSYNEP